MFGGQGLPWLDELIEVCSRSSLSHELVDACSQALLEELSSDEAKSMLGFYEYGFDVKRWMHGGSPRPRDSYLFSAPISYPMVFITQLAQYAAFVEEAGLDAAAIPDVLRAGVTGHSQGIVAALTIALKSSVSSLDKLIENATLFARLQFWQGARVQQAAPRTSLPPALETMDEVPTPMLSM